MIAFGGNDDVHASARAHAARGEWGVVRSLLAGDAAAGREPELLLLAAEAAMRVGLPREASERLRDGWAGLEGAADGAALRRACNLLGAAAFELGDLTESHRAFARALELAGADGDHLLVARATNNLGAIANLRGDRERALTHFQLAIPAYQQLGHTRGLAESCHNIAIAYRDARRLEDAEDYERRAMEYAHESGSARVAAMARAGRAELSLLRGDPRLAEREATIAAEAHRRLEDPIGEADALRLVGEARIALGTIDAAMRAIDAAVNLATAHGAALVRAEALRTRAGAHRVRGEARAARDDARAALELFEQLGAIEERNRTAELLGSLGV
ncbi:MAG TPA: tetratricopeptide repeat protein [Gemmatimonadaceae bacterium]|nr:tetratricopeptide repeat protein [Gemmatimonadaceae bacterium]